MRRKTVGRNWGTCFWPLVPFFVYIATVMNLVGCFCLKSVHVLKHAFSALCASSFITLANGFRLPFSAAHEACTISSTLNLLPRGRSRAHDVVTSSRWHYLENKYGRIVHLTLWNPVLSSCVHYSTRSTPFSVSVSKVGTVLRSRFVTSKGLSHHTHPLFTMKYSTYSVHIEVLRKELQSQIQSPVLSKRTPRSKGVRCPDGMV